MIAFHSLRALPLAILLFACAPTRLLPPPREPAHVLPPVEMPNAPPADGMGRVVIDAQDDVALVSITSDVHRVRRCPRQTPRGVMELLDCNEEIVWPATAPNAATRGKPDRSKYPAWVKERDVTAGCTTPCALDLPLGNHTLLVAPVTESGLVEEVKVTVGETTTAVRVQPGRSIRAPHGPLGTILIGAGVVTSIAGGLVAIGGSRSMSPSDCTSDCRSVAAPLISGGVLLSAGTVLIVAGILTGRPMERPAAVSQWVLP